jgi:hypothetical protein
MQPREAIESSFSIPLSLLVIRASWGESEDSSLREWPAQPRIPPIAWWVEGGAWRVEGRTGGIFRLCWFSGDEVGSEGAPMASFARFRRFGADELASFVRFSPLLTRASTAILADGFV